MSAALNQRADTSGQSIPDLSLGSVLSGFSTPAKSLRIPSTSSQTTALSSVPERTRWENEVGTPLNGRGKRRSSAANVKSTNLTLRDQEKHIDNLKNENFNIKLKVHFLEERLAQLAPDQVESALKQNINLKIELVLKLERELEQSQKGAGRSAHERKLEALLQERDRDPRATAAAGALRDAEERNAELEELKNVRRLLEEIMDELERLKDTVERRDDTGQDGRQLRRMDELKKEIEELKAAPEEQADLLAERDEEKEELLDQQDALRLQLEDVERRREADGEERHAAEDDVNTLRDKLAAASIELQQKEDEIGFKSQEISELINEHQSILDDVEGEWKGDVDEAKTQIEELRDAFADRDAESEELRMQTADFEANDTAMHEKYEAAFAHLEREAEEKDEEIASANREIEQLGQRICELEEDTEELKRKIANIKAELQEGHHRARQEGLTRHIQDLVAEVNMERAAGGSVQLTSMLPRKFDADLRRERCALEAKDAALQTALAGLAHTQALLSQQIRQHCALAGTLASGFKSGSSSNGGVYCHGCIRSVGYRAMGYLPSVFNRLSTAHRHPLALLAAWVRTGTWGLRVAAVEAADAKGESASTRAFADRLQSLRPIHQRVMHVKNPGTPASILLPKLSSSKPTAWPYGDMDVTSYTIIQSARTCILFTIIRIDPTRQMHSSLPHCARNVRCPPHGQRRRDLWDILIKCCPNLQELTLDGFTPHDPVEAHRLTRGRWPTLRTLTLGDDLHTHRTGRSWRFASSGKQSVAAPALLADAVHADALARGEYFAGVLEQLAGFQHKAGLRTLAVPDAIVLCEATPLTNLPSLTIMFRVEHVYDNGGILRAVVAASGCPQLEHLALRHPRLSKLRTLVLRIIQSPTEDTLPGPECSARLARSNSRLRTFTLKFLAHSAAPRTRAAPARIAARRTFELTTDPHGLPVALRVAERKRRVLGHGCVAFSGDATGGLTWDSLSRLEAAACGVLEEARLLCFCRMVGLFGI
ncbi:hypothetical protein FA95DRAFT_1578296 [Auriscalpium vulgare]|uniref:Uncharacterized protein n=1 Tax=Auriscalpium vulgare TaxID=40419 RepID=A0ACB8R2Z0_9AGAM|nr:hypothetical protein FA95DRAFT_1578296 [Auriscalpium vulgare]